MRLHSSDSHSIIVVSIIVLAWALMVGGVSQIAAPKALEASVPVLHGAASPELGNSN